MAGFEFNLDTTEFGDYAKVLLAAGGKVASAGVLVNLTYAMKVRDTARDLVPFDTGRLHDSIAVVDRGLATDIVADAPYAGFVEFGTVRMAPRPFLRPAMRKHRKGYRQALLNVSVGVLRRKSFVGVVGRPGGLRQGSSAGRARG